MMNALDAVSILFEADGAPVIVGHNVKYDLHMWANIGVDVLKRIKRKKHRVDPIKVVADTMTMIHAIDEEHMCNTPLGTKRRSKALKNLAFHYLGDDAHVYEDLVAEVRVAIANYCGISSNDVDYYMVGIIAPEIMKDYACADVEFTYKLYHMFLEMLEKEETTEAYWIDIRAMIATWAIQRFGVKVNIDKMRDDEGILKQIRAIALSGIREMLHAELNPDSTEEVVEAMAKTFGVQWHYKTEKGRIAFDKGAIKLFGSEHPEQTACIKMLDLLLTYRKVSKILSTYIYNTLEFVQDDGRVHADFNINPNDKSKGGTKTGRLSSSNPNLQNVPKKIIKVTHPSLFDANGDPMVFTFNPREYYVSDVGSVFIFNDFDAQEYSVLGHYSQDQKYIDGLNSGRDIHKFTYSEMYKKPYDEVTADDRQEGKQLGFSVVYQIGNPALAVALGRKLDLDRLKPATRFMYSQKPAYMYPPYKNPKMTLDVTLELAERVFKSRIAEIQDTIKEMVDNVDYVDTDNKLANATKLLSDTQKEFAEVLDGITYYFDPYVLDSIDYAIQTKKRYMDNFPKIKEFLDKAKKVAAERMWVRTYWGRKRHIKDKMFAYAMPNAIIQGTCADIMKIKMFEVWLLLLDYESEMVLSVHDELGWLNFEGEEFLRKQIKDILEDLPFRVRITVGSEVATDWGHKSDMVEADDLDDELDEETE